VENGIGLLAGRERDVDLETRPFRGYLNYFVKLNMIIL
jgi:hypothetical protein